jgi:hypothetical protein
MIYQDNGLVSLYFNRVINLDFLLYCCFICKQVKGYFTIFWFFVESEGVQVVQSRVFSITALQLGLEPFYSSSGNTENDACMSILSR